MILNYEYSLWETKRLQKKQPKNISTNNNLPKYMNKYIKIIFSILAVLFGLFLIIFGGYDDSPGAQGLGLILIIATVIIMIRNKNKK